MPPAAALRINYGRDLVETAETSCPGIPAPSTACKAGAQDLLRRDDEMERDRFPALSFAVDVGRKR